MPEPDDFKDLAEALRQFEEISSMLDEAHPLAVAGLLESSRCWDRNRGRLDKAGYDRQPELMARFDHDGRYISVQIIETRCGLLVGILPPTLIALDGRPVTLNKLTAILSRERACQWMCLGWLHLTGEHVSVDSIIGRPGF